MEDTIDSMHWNFYPKKQNAFEWIKLEEDIPSVYNSHSSFSPTTPESPYLIQNIQGVISPKKLILSDDVPQLYKNERTLPYEPLSFSAILEQNEDATVPIFKDDARNSSFSDTKLRRELIPEKTKIYNAYYSGSSLSERVNSTSSDAESEINSSSNSQLPSSQLELLCSTPCSSTNSVVSRRKESITSISYSYSSNSTIQEESKERNVEVTNSTLVGTSGKEKPSASLNVEPTSNIEVSQDTDHYSSTSSFSSISSPEDVPLNQEENICHSLSSVNSEPSVYDSDDNWESRKVKKKRRKPYRRRKPKRDSQTFQQKRKRAFAVPYISHEPVQNGTSHPVFETFRILFDYSRILSLKDSGVECPETTHFLLPNPPPSSSGEPVWIQQPGKFAGDLYTPRWVRGKGTQREGLCPICSPPSWHKTKVSAYWYHMNFIHGISSITGQPFQPPLAERLALIHKYPNSGPLIKREGLCGACQNWVYLDSPRNVDVNVEEIYWFKHAQKCHSSFLGQTQYF